MARVVRDDQGALELAGRLRVDAEVGGQLHRTAHALRDVHERAVGEHGRVQGGEEVVIVRNHRTEVLLHQLGILPDRFRDGAEDHPMLLELLAERRCDGDRIEHGVHRHARQPFPLLDGDPELLECLEQLGVDLFEAVQLGPLFGSRVIADGLIVDGTVLHVRPVRLGHLQPVAIGLEPPIEHPRRLALLLRDEPDDVLAQAGRDGLRFDIGDEAVLIRLEDLGFDSATH